MTKYKIGDTVTIRNGTDIARQDNPSGIIKVKIIKFLSEHRFTAITKFNNHNYVYYEFEVINYNRSFVFR